MTKFDRALQVFTNMINLSLENGLRMGVICVDKYEYNIKAEQIMKMIKKKDFVTAAKIADGIDWRRVKNVNMLTNVGSVYESVNRYQDAKEILLLAGIYANRESLDKVHMIGGLYRTELYRLVMEFLGKTINEYLGGDQELWKSTIDRVLEYEVTDPFNPMGLVPPPVLKDDETVQRMLNENREGILELRRLIDVNADSIRDERTRNGLENRE